MQTVKSANGVTGHLLRTAPGEYVFRVYDSDYNFVDYDLLHYDLCVTINDETAAFYRDEFRDVLDHTPDADD